MERRRGSGHIRGKLVDVDAVVLWVDGSDPQFQISYNKFSPDGNISAVHGEGAGRHRNNGELKYCLRCIEQNLPWIRRVHLVTNGQKPDFIKEVSWGKKIRLVPHSSILPENVLPTFNTFAIESALHLIPNLSDVFIRFSDDFFVAKKLQETDIMGDNGYGTMLFGAKVPLPDNKDEDLHKKAYLNLLAHNRRILEESLGVVCDRNYLHAPQVRHKSICLDIYNSFKEYVDFTRCSKFRTPKNFAYLYSYPHFLLAKKFSRYYDGEKYVHNDVSYKPWSKCKQILAGKPDIDWKAAIEGAFSGGFNYININDNFGNNPNMDDIKWLEDFMSSAISYPASWEV